MLSHDRRQVAHFNVTEHPIAQWTSQQLMEAFSFDSVPRYLLRDRDAIYSEAVRRRIKGLGIEEVVTAPRSPWQNPFCEPVPGELPIKLRLEAPLGYCQLNSQNNTISR